MDWTPVDWEKIFTDEPTDKTAVLVAAQPAQFLRDINLADHFNQYGVVETSRYERHNGYHYLIIEFKDAASATDLISKRSIVLRGVDFTVKPFHSLDDLIASIQHRNITHLSCHRASENSDENILHLLNDDCLGEIFGKIHSLFDVVSIENVCTRFKQIAERAFIPLLKRKQIDFMELKAGQSVPTLTDIETFLGRHGSFIVSVQLCEESFRNVSDVVNPILKLLQRYCPNLKTLILYKGLGFKPLDDQTVTDIRPLISKLRYVEIWDEDILHRPRNIPIQTYIDFIWACIDAETLILNIGQIDLNLSHIHYPKLKVFQSSSRYMKLDRFFAQNPQIEALNLVWDFASNRVQSICKHIPEIREVFLKNLPAGFTYQDSALVKNLKRARISMQWLDVDRSAKILLELTNITRLQFKIYSFMDTDILLELTKRLCNLENLAFIYCRFSRGQILSKEILMEMVRYATKLTKLRFKWPASFTDDYLEGDFNEILQVVKTRMDSLKLDIVLDSVTDPFDGDHGIKTIRLSIDPRWLNVTKRYLYLTRRDKSAYETFQRQFDESVIHTNRPISSLPNFDFVTSKHNEMKFNVI